ncbi:Nicotinate phosphoribosyltransferase [Mycena kentingensis (nom. inval.)]|nr:Nicotinate phosphoribosyltransferase [Mycena kentingensis (nom. inval.)]
MSLPCSLLDTDLYKLTMQQAVLHHFPNKQATYKFTLRDKSAVFTRSAFKTFQGIVGKFGEIRLTDDEASWLKRTCPYFTPEYLAYLKAYRFNPAEVDIKFIPVGDNDGGGGHIEIDIAGSWANTIFWEVPLMATLSEIYFKHVSTDWSYDGQKELAYAKGKALLEADCVFSEFGTRRRRSFQTQDIVVDQFVRATKEIKSKGKLSGTSNVYLAYKYNIQPVGTIAHEWFMGVAALKGYEDANSTAMDLWEEVYHNVLLIALTDTFSSKAFFQSYTNNEERALRWQGLRQDSGDPFEFGPRAKQVFESLGIDPSTKMIIYSDALLIEKALRLKQQAVELGLNVSFGIGTFLTNDFKKTDGMPSKALNMVIKLSSIDGKPCVKISDDLTKNTGDAETVQHVKQIYNLPA